MHKALWTVGGLLAGTALVGTFFATRNVEATTGSFGSIVGIEQHANPAGDRYVQVISPVGVFGLWVTDACAGTLALGGDLPSNAVECQN